MSDATGLSLHNPQEYEDVNEYIDYDFRDILDQNKQEINGRLSALKEDITTLVALENFTSSIFNKQIDSRDIAVYNDIVDRNQNFDVQSIEYRSISLESFDTLASTASSIVETVSDVKNKAIDTAIKIKEGVVNSAAFIAALYEKIKAGITKLAVSWDIICSLIEKRWLGVKQIASVYELQRSKLSEAFSDIELQNSSLASIRVKLYVGKLKSDGRDISNKDTLLAAINDDSSDIKELGDKFINFIHSLRANDLLTTKALNFLGDLRQATVRDVNIINKLLKNVTQANLFSQGSQIKKYQATSRVLVGGKVIYINYNNEDAPMDIKRKELRQFVANLNFRAFKKRDGSTNDVQIVELSGITYDEARQVFDSLESINDALRTYNNYNLPNFIKTRNIVSSITTFGATITGGTAAFDAIKRFFNQDDNLKTFNLIAPAAVSKLLATFLGASSFAAFSGIVAVSAASFLLNYLRKYILSNLFSMIDVQYKLTDIMENFDQDYIDTLMSIHNQSYRICKKLASSRNWD